MVKLYIVFGVDTAVGAAVAHHLSKRSKVKGIPLGHPKTKGEVDDPPGVEIARCDPSNSRSLEHILKDCDGCFIYTLTDFVNNPSSFMANELSYGRSIAEACKQAHVPHTIYCTEPHTTDILGVGARHMIAKAETEQCICVKDIPLTLLILPRLYEDLLSYLAPEQVEDHFVFELPMDSDIPLNMISAEDIGPIVERIFDNRDRFTDKRQTPGPLSVCGSKVSRPTFANCLSYNIQDLRFFDKPVTHTHYHDDYLKRPWREDYANMFLFLMRTRWDHKYSDTVTRSLNPDTLYFEEWVKAKSRDLHTAYKDVKPEDRLRWWFNKIYTGQQAPVGGQ